MSELREMVARFHWREVVVGLAHANARLHAEGPGPGALDRELRAAVAEAEDPKLAWLASYLRRDPQAAIANEASALFLIGIAAEGGVDDQPAPGPLGLALLFLLANDYCLDFRRDNARASGARARRGRLLVSGARSLVFNRHPDVVRDLVRTRLLVERYGALPEGKQAIGDWPALEREAFMGLSAHEYVTRLVGPLVTASHGWGTRPENGPFIRTDQFFAATKIEPALAERFLASLTIERDAIAASLRSSRDLNVELPRVTFPFHAPLVRLDERTLACVSPALLAGQLRTGMPARLRDAANRLFGRKRGGGQVMNIFGELIERWVVELLEDAAKQRVEMADWLVGGDVVKPQLTDAVIRARRNVILIEVKANTLREEHLKGAESPREAERWYDEFLFGKPGDPGALRQLDGAAARIRSGEMEAHGVPRDAAIFPVIVHYDELHLDQWGGFRWIEEECADRHVLTGADVRRTAVMDISTFEGFVGWMTGGGDPYALLEEWNTNPTRYEGRFELLLTQRAGGRKRPRLMVEAFDGLLREIGVALFDDPAALVPEAPED